MAVVDGLDHLEEHATVGDIDCCSAQLLVEGRIVEQIEVLEQKQTNRLIVGIESQQGTQLV
jgi:hypothetical protein